MKLLRFIAENNKVYYGVVESPEDNVARLVKGNIFAHFAVTPF